MLKHTITYLRQQTAHGFSSRFFLKKKFPQDKLLRELSGKKQVCII